MQKVKRIKLLTTLLVALFACALVLSMIFVLNPYKASADGEDLSPIYRLRFSDSDDRGANSASSEYGSATIVDNGNVSYEDNAKKGQAAIRLNGSSARQNYVQLPAELMNYDSVTLSGWFLLSSSISSGWSRMLEISNGNGANLSRLSLMPYAPNYYNGLHVSATLKGAAVDGADNMFFEGADSEAAGNTPKAYNILPVYDTWVHYAYEFTPEGFYIYQNGTLIKSKQGDFSAKNFYSADSSYIYLGATAMDDNADFRGGFSDIRVYSSALTGEEIASEYDFDYSDFLTTSYNFDNENASDSVRNYDATLQGNAEVVYDDERESYVLSLDGTRGEDFITAMKLPGKSIAGHNEITVSFDAYVSADSSGWARLFEFSPNHGSMLFSSGIKWGGSSSLLKFTNKNNVNDQILYFDFPYNQWINLAFSVDNNSARIYLDGKLIASEDNFKYNNSMFWDAGTLLTFGATLLYGDNPLIGKLDNVKIYQSALSEKETMMSLGIITVEDDASAVQQVADAFSVDYDGEGNKLTIPDYGDEGVKITWSSANQDIIDNDGTVFKPVIDTPVAINVTFTRGEIQVQKQFTVTVKSSGETVEHVYETGILGDTSFEQGSYYEGLMETNLDYMMSLNVERLLYNYRLMAGLDTKGVQSYGAWISTASGGAGQFEAHYVVALAKAVNTMPDYSYEGETLMERLDYMLAEWKKCQDAYAEKYPEDAGYLGAISAYQLDAIVAGQTFVTLENGVKQNIWVPWYFAHKHFEALLDVYNYVDNDNIQALALEMLNDYADWAYNEMSSLTDAERVKILRYEYGGMAEALYQTYMVTKNVNHFRAAKYFEEQNLLDNLYNNVDVLAGLHSNTTLPKILACAAAYEITGDEYYLTICENAYEMIMKRTYANGSTSCGEHWTAAGTLYTSNESSETCCSYNMLRLADYLYKYTGEKKYMDYYENVYLNHILASMDPDTGLKTYLTNSLFGFYKVYHNADNAFWCCACTGMESFAQLAQGIYYTGENEILVNMFMPSSFNYGDITLVQSGDFYTEQKTTLTINGSGSFKLSLRIPDWAESATILINGEPASPIAVGGYYVIDRTWSDGDEVEYSIPFSLRQVKLPGSERTYALMYGPILMVLDMGSDNMDEYQSSQLTFGSAYTGELSDKVVLNGSFAEAASFTYGNDGEIYMTLSTANQGELSFRPFNRLFHSRYGMYLEYYDDMAEIDADYTLEGNDFASEFDSEDDLDSFNEFGSTGGGRMFSVEDGWLVSPSSGENKLMAGLSLKAPYVLEVRLAPYSKGGQMNGGVYILASEANKVQDSIVAYNVHVERTAGSSTYKLNVFKFNGSYLGSETSVSLNMPSDEIISLHILVKDGYCSVFVNGSRNAALKFAIDDSFITEEYGDVGIRAQVSKMKFDGFRVISADLEKNTSVLESALSIAQDIDQKIYTPETVEALRALIEDAIEALADDSLTQAQINVVNNSLRAAIAGLIEIGDASDLDRALASAILIDGRNYTQTSFNALQSVIDRIKAIEGQKVSQSVIDCLKSDLSDALMSLEVASVDRTSLATVISSAEALVETEYTADSWGAFSEALAASKALSSTASAAEIDEAMANLLLAETSLVRVSNGSGTPSGSVDGDGSAVGGVSVGALIGSILGAIILTAAVIFGVQIILKKKKGAAGK